MRENSETNELASHELRKVRKQYVLSASQNPMGRYTRQDTNIPRRRRDPAEEQAEQTDLSIDN